MYLFWFTYEQWAEVLPQPPTNRRRTQRHDDRRIPSGPLHDPKIGCGWIDCPREYVPVKTICNRFAHGSERGIPQKIFEVVAVPSAPLGKVALDSSHIKTHCCASGGKGGEPSSGLRGGAGAPLRSVEKRDVRGPSFRRSGSPRVAETASYTRLSTSISGLGHLSAFRFHLIGKRSSS